jgi:hypothetical protein
MGLKFAVKKRIFTRTAIDQIKTIASSEWVRVLWLNLFSTGLLINGKRRPSHDFELSMSGDKDPRAHSRAFSLLNSIPCPIEAKASVKSEKDM